MIAPIERPSFEQWTMEIAHVVSQRSEDPYVQVGSVVATRDWRVLGVGYNGLPPGVNMPRDFWEDRDGRRPYMIHAEINALRGVTPTVGMRIISTHIPCASCMSVIGSYQVDTVVYQRDLGEAHDMELIRRIARLNRINLYRIGE